MRELLALLLPLVFIVLVTHSSVYTTLYYNGTVVIHAFNQTQIYLPFPNSTPIRSNFPFKYEQDVILVSNSNFTLEYNTKLSNIIKFSEPYNITLCVILPERTQITYLSTSPTSATIENNILNLTFYSSNLTLIYTYSLPQNNSSYSLLLIVSFALSLISTSVLIYLLVNNLRKTKVEEPILLSGLDERDRIVLDAISKGADSIAKISKVTGLSRATVYRRVKKLVSLGYIKEVREGNKVRYEENKKE